MLFLLYGANPVRQAQYDAFILALDPTGTDPTVDSGVAIGLAAADALHAGHYRRNTS